MGQLLLCISHHGTVINKDNEVSLGKCVVEQIDQQRYLNHPLQHHYTSLFIDVLHHLQKTNLIMGDT